MCHLILTFSQRSWIVGFASSLFEHVLLKHELTAKTLSEIIKSPRKRCQRTFDLLFQRYKGSRDISAIPTETTEDVREWDYGRYEGITSKDIHKNDPDWDIFTHGCPEGESIEQMTERVDKAIARIRKVHASYWARVQKGECEAGTQGGDVLVVTHGHFSKCFLARWIQTDLSTGKHFIVDAGGCKPGSSMLTDDNRADM